MAQITIVKEYSAGLKELYMKLRSERDDNIEDKITISLTKRDIILLNLCLNLVERNHAHKGSLAHDIQSLQEKLILKSKDIWRYQHVEA